MTVEAAGEYFTCMSILRAREILDANRISSWPHMETKARNREHNNLLKDADLIRNKPRAATVQDIARIIGK